MGRNRGSGQSWAGLITIILCGAAFLRLSGCYKSDEEPGGAGDHEDTVSTLGKLHSLGYLSGYKEAPVAEVGVTALTRELVSPGYSLFNSGHSPSAELIRIDGEPVYSWEMKFEEVWPDHETVFTDFLSLRSRHRKFWRKVEMDREGNLYAIFELNGLIKVDRHSRLIWKYSGGSHHDLELLDDDTLWVLDMEGRKMGLLDHDRHYMDNLLTRLDANGHPLERISIYDAIVQTKFARLLQNYRQRDLEGGDVFHCNGIDVLDGRAEAVDPAFRRGNILVSILWLGAHVIIDPDLREVVWAYDIPLSSWHQPTLLENGSLLYFDNMGGKPNLGLSRVVEIDVAMGKRLWSFNGSRDDPLESLSSGSCQRLPNGNTLIVESNNGRAIEVTRDKEVVWEFRNPHRAGGGRKSRRVATLYDLARYDVEFVDNWLHENQGTDQ